jgi:hypothetical protein
MSSPKTHTLRLQYGQLVRLNDITLYLVATLHGIERSPLVQFLAPDIVATAKAARTAVSTPMVGLLLELVRLGVPSPLSHPRPPDYLELQLLLDEQLLQQLGDMAAACAESWQYLDKMMLGARTAAEQQQLQQYRKDSAEVAGYLLAALADAGVPAV